MLYPFFCYYGGKWRAAKKYPSPLYPKIIEPFAGAAGYSLRHPSHNVQLYDVDEVICGLWEYLISVKESEICKLPLEVKNVNDLNVPQEAKWLIGFWMNKGSIRPGLSPSSWMRSGIRPNSYWGEVIRNRIASQVGAIRHWRVKRGSYEICPNEQATWFIDPPYQAECGRHYQYDAVDYESLAEWCLKREGQTLVCEREGANWLPFKPLGSIKSTPGKHGKSYSREVLWTS